MEHAQAAGETSAAAPASAAPAPAPAPAPAKKPLVASIPAVPKAVQTIKLPPPPPAPAPEPARQRSASPVAQDGRDAGDTGGEGAATQLPLAAGPAPAPAVNPQEDLNDFQRRMMEMMSKKKEDAEKKQQGAGAARKPVGLKGAKLAIVPPSGLKPMRVGDASAAAAGPGLGAGAGGAAGVGPAAAPAQGAGAGPVARIAAAGDAPGVTAHVNGVHAEAGIGQPADGVPRRVSPGRPGPYGRRDSRSRSPGRR